MDKIKLLSDNHKHIVAMLLSEGSLSSMSPKQKTVKFLEQIALKKGKIYSIINILSKRMNLLRMLSLEIDAILELFKKDDRARNSSIVSNFPEFLSKQNRRDLKLKI